MPRHLRGGLQRELVVGPQPPPRRFERGGVLDADQHVLQSRTGEVVVVDVVGGHQRQAGVPRDIQQSGIGQVFRLQAMVLKLEKEAVGLEERGVGPRCLDGLAFLAMQRRGRNRAPQAARQPHQTARVPRQGFEVELRRSLGTVVMGRGGEPADVGVALPVARQQGEVAAPGQAGFHAHDGVQAVLVRRVGEPHRAVDPVVIRDRQRLQPKLGGAHRHFLGMRRTIEKREVGVRVQLGVGGAGQSRAPWANQHAWARS